MKKVPGSVNICKILGFLISNTSHLPNGSNVQEILKDRTLVLQHWLCRAQKTIETGNR